MVETPGVWRTVSGSGARPCMTSSKLQESHCVRSEIQVLDRNSAGIPPEFRTSRQAPRRKWLLLKDGRSPKLGTTHALSTATSSGESVVPIFTFLKYNAIVLGVTVFVATEIAAQQPKGQVGPLCQTGCFTYSVRVTPDNGGGAAGPAYTTGHSVSFTVVNRGNTYDTYSISCSGTNATCTGTSLSSVTLDPGMDVDVDAYFTNGDPGSETIRLTASSDHHATDDGTFILTVGPPVGAPLVDLTPYNFDNQDYGRCAQACFAATYAQSTVPYFS